MQLPEDLFASCSMALQAASWPAQLKLCRNMQEVTIFHEFCVCARGPESEKMSAAAKRPVKVSESRKKACLTAPKAEKMSMSKN